jgi:ABC-2 type transport system permease protein
VGAVGSVWALELGKLRVQVRSRVAAGACVVAPFALVAALKGQSAVPQDTLFGRWVHTSGFAVPLVILGFAGQWVFPLMTSIVAGDIFAAEDHYSTWKTILTRSRSRSQIFVGKVLAALTFSLALAALAAGASLAAGLAMGVHPLIGLSGQTVSAGSAAALVAASWASVLPGIVGFTALGLLLSVLTRSVPLGIGGPPVLGLLMQLVSLLSLPQVVQRLLLTTSFNAWHGFWAAPAFLGPIVWGVIVALAWTAVGLVAAFAVFARRDIPPR